MLNNSLAVNSATVQARHDALLHWLWLVTFAGISVMLAAAMLYLGSSLALVGWLLFLAGAVVTVREPRHGLYLILFLSLLGDASLMPWYPFTKNLSSRESILFLSDRLILSPAELYLVLTLLVWFLRGALTRGLQLFTGTLFWLALLFTLFVIVGLAYGLGRDGNVTVGLWEARSLFYLLPVLLLVSNLIETPQQASYLIWAFAAAVVVEAIFGTHYYLFVLERQLTVQAITEHAAAVQMNGFVILLVGVWIYRGSLMKRLLLPVAAPAVLITYVATQRRAANAALAIGLVFVLIILYRQRRTAFYLIAPILFGASLLYTAAFWNSTGALGLPAQALKAIVAPGQLSEQEQRSALYRQVEDYDLRYTIRSTPLLGIGFGQKFHRPLPLPDISWFVWWEYVPHNSILWLWLKTGAGGFLTFLLLFSIAIARGARSLWDDPPGGLGPPILLATLYLIMHILFAYVDIAWTAQSLIVLGMALGLIDRVEKLAAVPAVHPVQRWRWQASSQNRSRFA